MLRSEFPIGSLVEWGPDDVPFDETPIGVLGYYNPDDDAYNVISVSSDYRITETVFTAAELRPVSSYFMETMEIGKHQLTRLYLALAVYMAHDPVGSAYCPGFSGPWEQRSWTTEQRIDSLITDVVLPGFEDQDEEE